MNIKKTFQFYNAFLLSVVVFSVSLTSYAQKGSKHISSMKPNIVYILADDMGYGELGSYGQEKIETPNLDQLAKRGKRFTQHYAYPVCAPSRYLLMTGQNSGKAFIRGNHEWADRGDVWNFKAMEDNPYLEGQYPIPDSTITIAKILKKAGYTTALVGKWGLGAPMTAGTPNNQGFDYFYGYICQRQDHTYYSGHLWENNNRVPLDNRIVDPNIELPKDLDPLDEKNYEKYQQKDYAPDYLIKAALKFIDKSKDKPFFLYYPSPLPHVSLQAPKDLVAYYHKKFGDEKPFLGGSYFPCRYPHATYAAMITLLDQQVGQIIKKLKDKGVYDNTIIMFCSDNGPAYNAGVDPTFFKSAGPFNGEYGWGKGFLREGGIREPFLVSWPGKIQEGSTSNLISATIDMVPTFCDLLNLKVPKHVDGISILPTILAKGKQTGRNYLYFEYPEYGGQQAIRIGNWKGIRLDMLKGNSKWSLYDLATDQTEQHDVAAQHPEIIKKMKAISKKEHHTPELSRFEIPVLENEAK
ncbi:N-acetylgalactosamine-6-sulfatase [Pedobacter sp. HMWF019]|uniref:arylsulfatase n=1 Tax=Pedobacter sp. HMWF019 TaxID=2056856 RepID=UPI000D3BA380|nr:arylsulfatase [Pedobacter sp. HMWF019]PTT01280.1 N-acetylgalactosamine-6-sulfatase [Pedobacter sp. HMWF019]